LNERKTSRLLVLLKAIDDVAEKTCSHKKVTDSLREFIVARWSEGWDNNYDAQGRRTFERIPDWDIMLEVLEECADAFIYSVEVSGDGPQLSGEEEMALSEVSLLAFMAMVAIMATQSTEDTHAPKQVD